MKKNSLSGRYYPKSPKLKQIFRIMRITTFLLLVCVFCTFAENTHSQNARVSITRSNTQLEDILSEIESQTDYLFIYNNQVDINKKLSIKVKNKPVSAVLDNLLKNMGVSYAMEGTHIVLTKNTENSLPVQQQAKNITGTIVDVNGDPVIGANIVVKGTTNGTITDIDGHFTIEADSKSVLNVSYIGYLTKEVHCHPSLHSAVHQWKPPFWSCCCDADT